MIKIISDKDNLSFDLDSTLESQISNDFNKDEFKFPKYYQIFLNKEIGKGTFGTVYQGTYQLLDDERQMIKTFENIAIKKVKINTTEAANSLKNELSFLKKMSQYPQSEKYITKMHDFVLIKESENNVYIYIIMDLLESNWAIPLQSLLQRNYISTLKRFFLSMIEGLQFVHNQGIIHGDIKPANILYNPKKNRFVFSDFGVSCAIPCPGGFRGTIRYLEPSIVLSFGVYSYNLPLPEEVVIKPKRRVDIITDYFALGCVFWETVMDLEGISLMKKNRLKFCSDVKDTTPDEEVYKALYVSNTALIKQKIGDKSIIDLILHMTNIYNSSKEDPILMFNSVLERDLRYISANKVKVVDDKYLSSFVNNFEGKNDCIIQNKEGLMEYLSNVVYSVEEIDKNRKNISLIIDWLCEQYRYYYSLDQEDTSEDLEKTNQIIKNSPQNLCNIILFTGSEKVDKDRFTTDTFYSLSFDLQRSIKEADSFKDGELMIVNLLGNSNAFVKFDDAPDVVLPISSVFKKSDKDKVLNFKEFGITIRVSFWDVSN